MSEFFSAFRHFSGILASNIGILAAFKMEFRAIKIGTRSRSQLGSVLLRAADSAAGTLFFEDIFGFETHSCI